MTRPLIGAYSRPELAEPSKAGAERQKRVMPLRQWGLY